MPQTLVQGRGDRLQGERDTPDQRGPFERDRDRIIYSTAFRRLAGVTQVVGVAEGHNFHNRLTHSLKVAQISRRLAEWLLKKQKKLAESYMLSPEVVEAAALAHDIGHPPFGHIAEDELCRLIDQNWVGESHGGFEGNAQSFRILCNLSLRTTDFPGLNLTRATLAAILKYPWKRDEGSAPKKNKWGSYTTELEYFEFARKYYEDECKSLEAEIMDWADDIAYSIFDLDDFWRAGLIPIGLISHQPQILQKFLDETEKFWNDGLRVTSEDRDQFEGCIGSLLFDMPKEMKIPYNGSSLQRAAARNWSSKMVARYIRQAVTIEKYKKNRCRLHIEPKALQEVNFLKLLTRRFVILNPALSAQQHGQRKLVNDLFEYLLAIVKDKDSINILPVRWQEEVNKIESVYKSENKHNLRLRIVGDIISSMTEQEVIRFYKRLIGDELGSILEPIIL